MTVRTLRPCEKFGSWELAAEYPNVFAAVAPILGGGSESLAEGLSGVNIWAILGTDGGACSAESTRRLLVAIRRSGGWSKYFELERFGHSAWKLSVEGSANVMGWVFQQCGAAGVNGKEAGHE